MVRLKALDEVAYVRFASVYRRFADASEFMTELRSLKAPAQDAGGVPALPRPPRDA